MTYPLTLTRDERQAFDFVGDRYRTGYRTKWEIMKGIPEGKEWDSEEEITFLVPEPAAWEIRDCCDDEGGVFPLFGDELEAKMHEFMDKII